MASKSLHEEHKQACKIRKKFDQLLNEQGQNCLSGLLSYLVKDKTFFSDTGQLFHTSKFGNTALAEYFQYKPSVFEAFRSKINETSMSHICENGTVRNVIHINRLDISTLKLMLCNISGLVTCLSDIKGSFRFDKNNICSNPNHNSKVKCCPSCNHDKTKEGKCKTCHESKRGCKEKSTICCSSCGLCYYCSNALSKPICGSHELRESIGIIIDTRNYCRHCPEKGWEDLANGSIPEKLQHLGNNWDQVWNECAKAVECIWKYFSSTNDFRKRLYEIGKIQHEDCDDMSRSKSPESKKLNFTLSIKNKPTTSLEKKLSSIDDPSHSTFQKYVNGHNGVDDPLVEKIESILTEILRTQSSDYTFQANNLEIKCNKMRSAHLIPNDYFEMSFIIKQKHGTVEELFEEYSNKDSVMSKSLWTRLTKAIEEYAHSELGIKVKITRDEWTYSSIKLLLKMFKQDRNMWKETEKSAVLHIIQTFFAKHFPTFAVEFKNDEYFSRSDNNVLEMKFFTKNVSDQLTEKLEMKINLMKFEEKIKEKIELLRKKDITWQELFTSYDVEVKKFRLGDLNTSTKEIEELSIIADEEVAVRTELTGYVDDIIKKLSTASNVMFYSDEQIQIMSSEDPKLKKVLIDGPYGTGKSILLQEKAKQLAESGDKVLFLFGCKKSLLRHQLLLDWKELINDKKIVLEDLEMDDDNEWNFDQEFKHVFIDEMNCDESAFSFIILLAQSLEYFWIAPSKDFVASGKEEKLKKLFTPLPLKMVYRNTKNIIKFGYDEKNVDEIEIENSEKERYKKISYEQEDPQYPDNYPDGEEPDVMKRKDDLFLSDQGMAVEACKKMRKKVGRKAFILLVRTTDGEENLKRLLGTLTSEKEDGEENLERLLDTLTSEKAIETSKATSKLVEEHLKPIMKHLEEKEEEEVKCYINNPVFKDISNMKENPVEFLRGEGKRILITDTEAMQGFDWHSIVFYNSHKTLGSCHQRSKNVFLRAKTNLIVVDTYDLPANRRTRET